jgi:3-methylcrotonyl-CoA carboxylase alpha subunit
LIAKLVVHGERREEAAQKLAAACGRVEAWPVKTNAAFLARAAAHPDFVAGRIDTGFIGRHPELVPGDAPDQSVIAGAANALLSQGQGPWDALHGFRPGAAPLTQVPVMVAGHLYKASPQPGGTAWTDAGLRVLFAEGQAWPFGPARYEGAGEAGVSDGALAAPMPGMVTVLNVGQGKAVRRGEILLVLEAMKMENALAAPFDGVVAECNVRLGGQVQEGQVLIRMEKT